MKFFSESTLKGALARYSQQPTAPLSPKCGNDLCAAGVIAWALAPTAKIETKEDIHRIMEEFGMARSISQKVMAINDGFDDMKRRSGVSHLLAS